MRRRVRLDELAVDVDLPANNRSHAPIPRQSVTVAPRSKSAAELPVKSFKHQAALAAWLHKNHQSSPGVWVKFAKAASGVASVKYAEAVTVALCYGWIDGQAKSYDEHAWLQRFTPPRAQSVWSRINRTKALKLIDDGLMKPAWVLTRLNAPKRIAGGTEPMTRPPTLKFLTICKEALNKNPKAMRFFATLNSQNRYAILHRVQTPRKRPRHAPAESPNSSICWRKARSCTHETRREDQRMNIEAPQSQIANPQIGKSANRQIAKAGIGLFD